MNNRIRLFLFFILSIIPFCSFSQGKWTATYNEEGKLVKEERYEQGFIEERIYKTDTVFYKNLQPEQAGDCIIHKKNFKKVDSIPIGKWEIWNEEGELIREEFYSNGKLSRMNELKKFTGNLVLNPGFEEHEAINCGVVNNSKLFGATMQNWKAANMIMPLIYDTNECRSSPLFSYMLDSLNPKAGKAVVSVLLYSNDTPPLRSYIEGEFKTRLMKGRDYKYELWVQRNKFTAFAANNLGIYFSEQPVFEKKGLYDITPDITVKEIINTKGKEWLKISGSFKAPRFAKYIVIGNFSENSSTSFKEIRRKKIIDECAFCKTSAVYYLDNISVKATNDSVPKPKVTEGNETKDTLNISSDFLFDTIQPGAGKTFVLKNIFFDENSSVILPASFDMLDSLVSFLNKNPEVKIEIAGHTDNTGAEKRNKELSGERAKAIVSYLTDSNIEETRLSYKGYGSSKPIDINTSENGRTNNRRMEFKILEK